MSGLGPHAGFIIAAYGAFAVVLGGLIAVVLLDHAKQKKALAELERRGAGRRRSGPGAS